MEKNIYLCEGTPEGIFSAVYQAYEEKHGHENNAIQVMGDNQTMELFAHYIQVETDFKKAEKVARTIRQKGSDEVYEWIQMAAVSCEGIRADAIYRVIILTLRMGKRVLGYLTEPNVQKLFELQRSTRNEAHFEVEFLRFEELKSGLLFARINPKNAVLPFVAPHFADRFSGENWAIADTVHGQVVIHERKKGCAFLTMEEVDFDALELNYSDEEEVLQRLWGLYVDTIGIKERENEKLRTQMLPLRFRKYMKEFTGTK